MSTPPKRSFLFLQGVASPFFEKLATQIQRAGHHAHRINFCGGDLFYTEKTIHSNYQWKMEILPCYIGEVFNKYQVTDIVLFGDTRYVNQTAIEIAKKSSINIYVFEEGYIRPFWVTLEKDGVNANSLLPKNPLWYQEMSKTHKRCADSKETGYSLRNRASHDAMYRFANFMFQRRFPHYKSHRPHNGLIEYAGWTKRLPTLSLHHNKAANKLVASLIRKHTPFFLYPLQLNSDSQIQVHSPFTNLKESIEYILRSFSLNAASDTCLVIKNHPLDTGLINYQKHIKKVAYKFDLAERIFFIDGGDLVNMLQHAKGTVLINSTTGTQAMFHECPVCVLGTAIYDIEGLTFQNGIDSFWKSPEKPDKHLYEAFRKTLIHTTQVNGDFYSDKGIAMTVESSLKKMQVVSSNETILDESLLGQI